MKHFLFIKLTFRSWWRNKLFTAISLISLAIGITCTNLLITFVVHEYNMESSNPRKEEIYRLTQEIPLARQTKQSTYVYSGIVPQIVTGFPEIKSCLCLEQENTLYTQIGDTFFPEQKVVFADSTFLTFFPYQTISGNLKETFTRPGYVALSKELAKTYFGNTDCVGQNLQLFFPDQKVKNVVVSGVFKRHPQAMLQADILTSLSDGIEGSACCIMLNPKTDKKKFQERFESTTLPTLTGEGSYRLQPLQESYFDTKQTESISTFTHRDKILPIIGLLSAILVLFIACFNYVNLSFSRLLKQVKMIHVETLMGATGKNIRWQLFIDTLLTVLIGFILSILLTNDLLSVFNHLVTSNLTLSFIFSMQVLPVILIFILLLAVIPAFYMSRKVQRLTVSSYRQFFTGKKKQQIVACLVILQYIISIGLMMAFLVIRNQLQQIEQGGDSYKNASEITSNEKLSLQPLYDEMQHISGIRECILSRSGIFSGWGMAVPIKDNSADEKVIFVFMYEEMKDFLDFYHIQLLEPERTSQLLRQFPNPVIVNESFVRCLVPEGEDPQGQMYSKYLEADASCKEAVIAGIMKDMKMLSYNEQASPMRILLRDSPWNNAGVIAFTLQDNNDRTTMQQIENLWKKHFPDQPFKVNDTYNTYMSYNQDIVLISQLLLVYSIVSLLLTTLGLFGIAWYAAEQRTREIGIRKVNGASARQIILLLNRPFLLYVFLAYIIAAPVVYYLIHRWMEQFNYRINIDAGVFLIPLFIVLVANLITVSLNSWRIANINPIESIKE